MIKLFPGEHSSPGDGILGPVFYQHLAAYNYFLPKVAGRRILEIGCGDGYGSNLFAARAKSVLAIDSDFATINQAKVKYRRDNLEFRHVKFPDGPFEGEYDVVVSFQVLEHLPDPEPYLEKINDLLVEGGFFFLTTPNGPKTSYNENPYHFHEYTREELNNLLCKYFKNVEINGLLMSERMSVYEEQRRKNIGKIFALDTLGLRRFLPRVARIFFFNLLAVISRAFLSRANTIDVTINDFQAKEYNLQAVDLIGISSK